MTEAEWLACAEPEVMLRRTGASSERKRRLFCCAAAAYLGADNTDERRRIGIAAVELCADSGEALALCPEIVADRSPMVGTLYQQPRPNALPFVSVGTLIAPGTIICTIEAMLLFNEITAEHFGIVVELAVPTGNFVEYGQLLNRILPTAESEAPRYRDGHVAALVRDIFGNPFRPVTFAAEWRTDTTLALARQMYESRDFSAMPILADALQDAGCDNDDILSHCRNSGLHARGCWVVDLLLGKE